jgi:peptide methionine sulfoxide reductase MsrA
VVAEKVRDELQKTSEQPIVTQIEEAGPFYQAEDYHQKFAERTGRGMCHIPYEPITQK